MVAPAHHSEPHDLRDPLIGQQLGRYEIVCPIASGGMATIYVGRVKGVAGFERLVAIKVLHPHLAHDREFITMFLDEARLAARINHPNVVGTLDVSDGGEHGYFIVMDYIEGHHFGVLLKNSAELEKPLPVPMVLRVVADALAGLAAAHDLTDAQGNPMNLIHRDISPHNIMVGVNGVARLSDFGVARAAVRLASTRSGEFKGKLAYSAPEYLLGNAIDQRADLFSMGVVLWEALACERLFRADSTAAQVNRILHVEIPKVSSLRPGLDVVEPILSKALERDPGKRFQTANEFLEALERIAPEVGGFALPRHIGEQVRTCRPESLAERANAIRSAVEHLKHVKLGHALDEQLAPHEITKKGPKVRRSIEPISDEVATTYLKRGSLSPEATGEDPPKVEASGIIDARPPLTERPNRPLMRWVAGGALSIALGAGVWWRTQPDELPLAAEHGPSVHPARTTGLQPVAPAPLQQSVGPTSIPPATSSTVPAPEATQPAPASERHEQAKRPAARPLRAVPRAAKRAPVVEPGAGPPKAQGPASGTSAAPAAGSPAQGDDLDVLLTNPYRR